MWRFPLSDLLANQGLLIFYSSVVLYAQGTVIISSQNNKDLRGCLLFYWNSKIQYRGTESAFPSAESEGFFLLGGIQPEADPLARWKIVYEREQPVQLFIRSMQ